MTYSNTGSRKRQPHYRDMLRGVTPLELANAGRAHVAGYFLELYESTPRAQCLIVPLAHLLVDLDQAFVSM